MITDIERKAAVYDFMNQRRRETDASFCIVVERKNVWRWVLVAFLVGVALGWLL